MWERTIRTKILPLFAFLWGTAWAVAQGPIYKPGEYPAPVYPNVKPHYTVEELLPIAREVVRRPILNTFLNAGYAIQPGQRALLVVNRDFDRLVLEAVIRAIREAEGQVDVVVTDHQPRAGGDGSIEALSISEADPMGFWTGQRRIAFTEERIINLAENGGYDILIHGAGGPHHPIKIPWQYIFWDRIDKFVTAAGYPYEVHAAIDKAAWAIMLQANKIHARDPEGTDIQWTVKPNYWDEAKKTYQMDVVIEGHISAIPLGMAPTSFMESDAEGVIGGTTNHAGPFPNIRVSFSKGSAVGIEGGGTYGQLWQKALDKWREVQWPYVPGPGINKLFEVAIGTHPKSIRPKDAMDYSTSFVWERTRSGVIHWGIGAIASFIYEVQIPQEFSEFRSKNTVPEGHVHIHNDFITMEVETKDGKKLLMINKGHLTALDDPKVRQIAAKFGDPDKLLQEAWVPAVPGINVPGDYQRDYARDPAAYIRKNIAESYTY